MKELSTHIEYLLLSHDCVVVPQFGAFMTMEASASRSDEEQLFFPPLRRVRFNADVTEDDGLLVASVGRTHGLDGSRAKHHVQTMVLNLRQQLLADGQVDFGSIGIFTQDEDGHVEFSACQAGSVSPAFYGLDAFTMPKVAPNKIGSRARGRHKHLFIHDADSHITIHISRRMLRHALTTAAAVILCVMFSVPLRDSTNGGMHLASLTTTAMTSHNEAAKPRMMENQQATTTGNEADSRGEQTAKTEAQAPSIKPEQAEQTSHKDEPLQHKVEVKEPHTETDNQPSAQGRTKPEADKPQHEKAKPQQEAAKPQQEAAKPKAEEHKTATNSAASVSTDMKAPSAYAVVLASATSQANAAALVNKLHNMGYANARIYDNGRLKRVILDGYSTEELALNAKHALQLSHDGFDDAWLLRP